MKYKNILLYFGVVSPSIVILRILQTLFTVEGETGFTKREYSDIGMYLTILIYLAVVITAFIGFTVRRRPEKMPMTTLPLGISAIALGLGMIYDAVNIVYAARIPMWQIFLLDIFGFLSAIFFIIYGIGAFVRLRLPRWLYILPVLYWIVRIVYTFTAVSSLTLITDNVLMLLHYSSILLFLTEFAKLANGVSGEKSASKIMAFGLSAVMLCAVSALPRLFLVLIKHTEVLHENLSSIVSGLLTGAFIAIFIFSHFKNGHKYMPDEKSVASKIMGEDA